MTTMEIIAGAIATVLAVIFGAFHLGKSQGKGIATAEAEKKNADEAAAATVAAAERRSDVTKEASDVQEDVKRMGDDDVDRELREKFIRPSGS